MRAHPGTALTLFTPAGSRKYLTPAERQRFIDAAWRCERREVGTLCLTLAYTGCRISEALALTQASLDVTEAAVVFRSLKKRGAVAFRQIPIPSDVLYELRQVHEPAELPMTRCLWSLCRGRAWQLVKETMLAANVVAGPHCTPKGLRHAFGINAIQSGVPVNLVQRWLGHADLATTAIYLDATGSEERKIAERMW